MDVTPLPATAAGASDLVLTLAVRPNPVVLADILEVLGTVSAEVLLAFVIRLGAAEIDLGRSVPVVALARSRLPVDIVLVDCVRAWPLSAEDWPI